MSVPAWERDDRPGVKVFSKICPDCAVMDAEGSDPRRGMRHASEFGLHYRSQDGLQPYCRHHMRQRRRHETATPAPGTTGHLSAAAVRALRPPEEGDQDDRAQDSPLIPSEVPPETTDLLMESLATLERSVTGLEERLMALEDPRPGPPDALPGRLQAVVEALAQRVAALERSEKDEDDGLHTAGGHESANTRSLRRWTKQLGKEVGNLAGRVERAEAKTAEAIRLAQAAGRINAGRPAETLSPEGPPPPDPAALQRQLEAIREERLAQQPTPAMDEAALEVRLADAIKADVWQETEKKVAATMQTQVFLYLPQILSAVDAHVDEHLAALPTKEKGMTHTPVPTAVVPHATAEGMDPIQDTLVALLARYAHGLHNLGQIEHDGLLDADLVATASQRLMQRTAGDLRSLIDDLLTTEERKP